MGHRYSSKKKRKEQEEQEKEGIVIELTGIVLSYASSGYSIY